MTRHVVHAILLAALVAAPTVARAVVITIDFDHPPADTATLPSGTNVNDTYAPVGVTFSAVGPGCAEDGIAYATRECELGNAPSSQPNVVSTCGGTTCAGIAETYNGLVRATFAFPVDGVCITVFPEDATGQGVIRVYDGSGQLLDEVTSHAGVVQQMCLPLRPKKTLGSTGIYRAEFSGSGTTFAEFDDLIFSYFPEAARSASWGKVKSLYR